MPGGLQLNGLPVLLELSFEKLGSGGLVFLEGVVGGFLWNLFL